MKTVFAHGFVNDANNQKMSKSLGNVVDPIIMLDKYSVDAFRFFLLRESSYGSDLPFSEESLVGRFNSELADTFGNAVHRGVHLCEKYCDAKLPPTPVECVFELNDLRSKVESAFQHVAVHEALELTLAAVRDLNKYLTDREPWKMKDKAQELQRATVVRTTLEAVYVLAHFLEPYLPEACAKVVEMLHTPLRRIKDLDPSFKNLKEGTVITVGEVLFKKIETEKAQKPIQTLELRVAKVESAVNHPTKDTLYLLQLDVGDEKRQVVSGLRAFYSATDLVGRKLLLFANLKPVKFGGELSSVSSPSSHSISQPSNYLDFRLKSCAMLALSD